MRQQSAVCTPTLLAADRADRPEGTRRQKPGLVWVKAASGANPPGVLKLSLVVS